MDFMINGPEDAAVTVILAHGAGAPMDSGSLTATAEGLVGAGLGVARFEFGYMASRRTASGRKPPPRAEKLKPEYIAAIDAVGAKGSPERVGPRRRPAPRPPPAQPAGRETARRGRRRSRGARLGEGERPRAGLDRTLRDRGVGAASTVIDQRAPDMGEDPFDQQRFVTAQGYV